MKTAVIFFHKNILSLYKRRWIDKCINSVKSQTYQDFDVFEIDYSGRKKRLCKGFGSKHHFYSIPFDNHIQAMNFILNEVFSMGYDVVFNTNMDDWYAPERFEKQIERINEGFSLVSSNFHYITEVKDGEDIITRDMNMFRYEIRSNLKNDHNVIAHPCVAMHRRIWDAGLRYNEDEVGYEDLTLWKKIDPAQISILQDYLLYYRIHDNQITKTAYAK